MAAQRIFVTGWLVPESESYYIEVWEFYEEGRAIRLANAYIHASDLEVRAHDLARQLRGTDAQFPLLTAVLGVITDTAFPP